MELPVAVVLVMLWLVGAVLEGSCVVVLYLVGWALVRVVVGT